MGRISFLIQASQKPAGAHHQHRHQLDAATASASRHRECDRSSMQTEKTVDRPTRKPLQSIYCPNRTMSMASSPWTPHKVAVAIIRRHQHVEKMKKEEEEEELPFAGDGSGRKVAFEGYLLRKFRPRKPSRFFFEHQAS